MDNSRGVVVDRTFVLPAKTVEVSREGFYNAVVTFLLLFVVRSEQGVK